MSTELLPDALRDAVGDDLQPVQPLHPAWQRTMIVAAVAVLVLTTVLFVLKMQPRPDIGAIPMWLSWGCSAIELMVGIFIVGLALREAVPGGAVPNSAVRLVLAVAILLQVLVGVATWLHSPGVPFGENWLSNGVGCIKHDSVMVLPVFLVTGWLVFRALPLRAPVAGLLGGAGAAITGDAITHLLCPMSDLRHVLIWHTGAILGFMALGWLAGTLWQRRRWR